MNSEVHENGKTKTPSRAHWTMNSPRACLALSALELLTQSRCLLKRLLEILMRWSKGKVPAHRTLVLYVRNLDRTPVLRESECPLSSGARRIS
jgi:hypothetical protein